jgi:glutamate synthase domain-containing protein 3
MRGGSIFIKGNVGYRAGVLMKEYTDKVPAIIIGGKAGSFLGEYLAGGLIIVLDLDENDDEEPVGNFAGTGMHGGKIYIRCKNQLPRLPEQVSAELCEDLSEIAP